MSKNIRKKVFLKKIICLLEILFIFAYYPNLLSVKKAILLFVAVVFIYVYTNAKTYFSIGNGNWTNTTIDY
jgi:hypothetical protein